jgi:prepilin-type N-terminal cleavage/methylation domain-containing protein
MNHKAFTLIELLVVIAIIAILAAILFPVFAQAKLAAKKTAALSDIKQTGTAAQLYLGDNDDSFPFAFAMDAQNSYLNLTAPVPVDAADPSLGWNTAAGQALAGQYWANSMQPYMKNTGLFELPGFNAGTVAGDLWIKTPAKVGIAFNGLFHGLNSSVVAAPSTAVVFWPGYGNTNVVGHSISNPILNCTVPGPCVFAPGGNPQGGSGNAELVFTGLTGQESYWTYNQTITVSRADSSAKAVNPGTTVAPAFSGDPWGTPLSSVTSTGQFQTFWDQCQPGTSTTVSTPESQAYWCYFRPDRTQ